MKNAERTYSRLHDAIHGKVEVNKSLASMTSYRIGGPASIWVEPASAEDVGKVLSICHEKQIPFFPMGNGTNLLIADEGFDGVVIHLGENLSGIKIGDYRAEVNAGNDLLKFINTVMEHGYAGMELMSGIPGSIGGAVKMNAGAFGQEISKCFYSLSGYSFDGVPYYATREDLEFGYRRVPQLDHVVITSAVFQFEEEDPDTLRKRSREILDVRAKKQPLDYPSCGSVFKRPKGYYAGALIEEIGMKGFAVGGAMVSPIHAGFIVNTGNATARDVLEIIKRIENEVADRFGVTLEREVKLVGFHGKE